MICEQILVSSSRSAPLLQFGGYLTAARGGSASAQLVQMLRHLALQEYQLRV
jgi:hypothetical protein